MIDHAISPMMFVLLSLALVATGTSLGILLDRVLVRLWQQMTIAATSWSPVRPDRLVGITVVVCGVIYLISDYANDWYGVL